jgi:WD40 repeat protein
MEPTFQQNKADISFISKKGHKDQVISSCCFKDANNKINPFLFVTNSEDGEIRMWDLRVQKSAKLFKMPISPNQGIKSGFQI